MRLQDQLESLKLTGGQLEMLILVSRLTYAGALLCAFLSGAACALIIAGLT